MNKVQETPAHAHKYGLKLAQTLISANVNNSDVLTCFQSSYPWLGKVSFYFQILSFDVYIIKIVKINKYINK